MKKTKKNKLMVFLITALLTFSVTACGNESAESFRTDSTEENTEEIFEDILMTVESDIPYIEANNLVFTEKTKVSTHGTLCIGEDTDNPDIIDIDWEITNITINDAVEGVQTVIIKQAAYGYIWTDGNIFKTNLNLPGGKLCDIYSGKIFPVGDDDEATEIEWKGNSYTITATESVSWIDGDWSTGWVDDPAGGKRLSSTLCITTTVTITEGYDGLGLVLSPITDTYGKYIIDVWTDESYLFDVNDLSSKLEKSEDEEGVFVEESSETEIKQEEMEHEETTPVETTAPKQEEAKPAHTHNYTSVITAQPTCTAKGIKTYSCQICGSSYTENIAAVPHDFSIPIIQLVHHDEEWRRIPRQVEDHKQLLNVHCNCCGADLASDEEFTNHILESIERETHGGEYPEGALNACNGWCLYTFGTKTVYDEEKISDAYDAEEIVGYQCSMCGWSTVR